MKKNLCVSYSAKAKTLTIRNCETGELVNFTATVIKKKLGRKIVSEKEVINVVHHRLSNSSIGSAQKLWAEIVRYIQETKTDYAGRLKSVFTILQSLSLGKSFRTCHNRFLEYLNPEMEIAA